MSDGGAQLKIISLGSDFAGGSIDFYEAGNFGTSKSVWNDETKSSAITTISADTRGVAIFYADGDYWLRVKDSKDNTLYDWPFYKITSDTATMWEGNFGTSFPSATSANKWQLFSKHNVLETLVELGINTGSEFVVLDELVAGDLNDTITAIGASDKTVVVKSSQTLTANLVVPSNVTLVGQKEGMIVKDSTYTVTINGNFQNGLSQLFSGFSTGDVTFGGGYVKEILPEWWGAIADGTTDCFAGTEAAIESITKGDIVYSGGGVYVHTESIRPNSNQRLVFKNKSSIKNTAPGSPNNQAIDARGVLGTAYAIDTPTIGSSSIVATAHGNAANFSADDFIFVAGPDLSGAWVPGMMTKVISSNAGTGVIVLDEEMRRTDFTQVFIVTTIKENIEIIDATIDQCLDSAIVIKYGYNVLVENPTVGASVGTAGISIIATNKARLIGYRGLYGNPVGFNSVYDGLVDSSLMIQSQIGSGISCTISIEGGCESILISNNIISDSINNSISVNTRSQNCTIIGNRIFNVPAGIQGIDISGYSLGYGKNVIMGNHITADSTSPGSGIAISSASHYNTIVGNSMYGLLNGILVYSGNNDQTISGNAMNSVTNEYTMAGTSNAQFTLGSVKHIIRTLEVNSTTPSITEGSVYYTANTAPTTISTFVNAEIPANGTIAQEFTVIVNDNNTTFDFTLTNLKGNGGVDFVAEKYDTIRFVYDGFAFFGTVADNTP